MTQKDKYHDAAELIKQYDDFLIISHENPDGDSLGSMVALALTLRKLNKKVQAVSSDPVPKKYSKMPGVGIIIRPDEAKKAEHIICLDCSNPERTGAVYLFEEAEFSICIDHHLTQKLPARINLINPQSASTGELVLLLIKLLEVDIDKDIAECILTAISTDTGHFSYGTTSPSSFMDAAFLLEKGANLKEMCRNIYKNRTLGMTLLIGIAIRKMEMMCNGKAVITTLTLDDFRESKAMAEDTEGIIDYLRDIETVEVAALIREANDSIKVSMRSKGNINVADLCTPVGGGGHLGAAGVTFKGSNLNSVIEWTKETLKRSVNCDDRHN